MPEAPQAQQACGSSRFALQAVRRHAAVSPYAAYENTGEERRWLAHAHPLSNPRVAREAGHQSLLRTYARVVRAAASVPSVQPSSVLRTQRCQQKSHESRRYVPPSAARRKAPLLLASSAALAARAQQPLNRAAYVERRSSHAQRQHAREPIKRRCWRTPQRSPPERQARVNQSGRIRQAKAEPCAQVPARGAGKVAAACGGGCCASKAPAVRSSPCCRAYEPSRHCSNSVVKVGCRLIHRLR